MGVARRSWYRLLGMLIHNRTPSLLSKYFTVSIRYHVRRRSQVYYWIMPEIAGILFESIAREWRFKWSPEDDKKSLVEAQKALESVLPALRSIPGVRDIKRLICGGCFDFKVIIALDPAYFSEWISSCRLYNDVDDGHQ